MRRSRDQIEDEFLVLRCQNNKVDALEALVRRWQEVLWRHARRMTGGDGEAAADVTQEAWMAIVRGIRRLDDPARFRGWAYRIVSRRAADWVRRRQRDRAAAAQFNHDDPSTNDARQGESDQHDDIARLRCALRELSPDHQTVLALH